MKTIPNLFMRIAYPYFFGESSHFSPRDTSLLVKTAIDGYPGSKPTNRKPPSSIQ
jgi:hypothetical protein